MESAYDYLGGPFIGNIQYHIRGQKDTMENINILRDDADLTEVIEMLGEEKDRLMNDDPFIVCDLGEVIRRYERIDRLMPNIRPYFAIKSNPSDCIAQLLFDLGTGFDCSSMNEIKKVRNYGATKNDVIFASTVKQESHLRYCQLIHYPYMTFDSKEELMKIKNLYSDAKPLIRIKAESGKILDGMGEKFGVSVKDAEELILFAKEEGIKLVGVSFHIGWKTPNKSTVFKSTIDDAFRLASRLTNDPNEEIIVDIGGGFGGYKDTDPAIFEDICSVVRSTMEENLKKCEGQKIKLICEPGCYFTSVCMTLVCQTLSKKVVINDEKRYEYFINDSNHGTFTRLNYGITTFLPQLCRKKNKEKQSSALCKTTLWGCSCNGFDLIKKDIMLPEMDIGDRIMFHSIGDYSLSFAAGAFCGFPGPTIIYVAEEKYMKYLEAGLPGGIKCLKLCE